LHVQQALVREEREPWVSLGHGLLSPIVGMGIR
jgi:hypothetical protein